MFCEISSQGFYRGVTPGITGSLATGAIYFGVIKSTKKWIEESHPDRSGHWAHFIAGGVGDTLGSFIYVPCEVMKQRMQVQGTKSSWSSSAVKGTVCQKSGSQMYAYYTGMFQAGGSIFREQGLRGLYAGYWSTLARDVPFAGLMGLKCLHIMAPILNKGTNFLLSVTPKSLLFLEVPLLLTEILGSYSVLRAEIIVWISSSLEGLLLGGLAGGFSAYLTTPLDVIKTRLQVQGPTLRYNGWLNAITRIWMVEGAKGLFRGSVPRIIWYIPASALTFMAVEFLRDHFNGDIHEVANLSVEKKGSTLRKVV
ncbi:hypothetical protein IFM89_008142 [Coptis chinensis]|uniref:Mitochondrial carrier protein n=1 Tax=Coptis chinensis TaxID=261450 RepID=A0A835MEK7_9MAGN|nr:hypothetical protein IFM89_008142 [Coptis chinensis]